MTFLRKGIKLMALKVMNAGLGFSLGLCVAMVLGATEQTDALFVAMSIPITIGQDLIPFFIILLVPVIVAEKDEQATDNWPPGLGIPLLLIASVSCLLMEIFAAPVIRALGPGLSEDALRTGTTLFRWLMPAFLLALLFAVCQAVLHAERRFYRPELGRLFWRLIALAGLFVAGGRWGVVGYAASILAACVVRLVAVVPGPLLLPQFWTIRGLGPLKRTLGMGAAALVIVSFFDWGMMLMVRAVASLAASGSVTLLDYANRLAQFAPLLLAQSFFVVILPEIAALQKKGFSGAALARPVSLLLFSAGVPVAGAVYWATPHLAQWLCQHSRLAVESIEPLTLAIRGYVIGVPAVLAHIGLKDIFLVKRDVIAITKIGGVQMAVLLAGLWALHPFGVGGIALSISLASWGILFYLWRLLALPWPGRRQGIMMMLAMGTVVAGFGNWWEMGPVVYFSVPFAAGLLYTALSISLWRAWCDDLKMEYKKGKTAA